MLFKKDELKLLLPFYLYYLIISLSGMIFPFLVIYFRDLSFSFFEISAIFASYSISMVVFEIPTGAFADGFSRKYSVIIGFLICSLALMVIGFATSFWVILLLFVVVGFGTTLVSGAEESWVIDNLNHHRRKDLHSEFFIKSQSIAAFGGIISPLAGSMIVKLYSINPLWYIWASGFLIGAFMLAVFSYEMYKPKKVKALKHLKNTLKNSSEGLKFARTHKTTRYLILASVFMAMMIADGDFWQPFLENLNMPIYMLGIVFSSASAVSMIVPFTARFLQRYKVKDVFIIMIIGRTILLCSILLLYPGLFFVGAGVFILSEGLISIRHPLMGPFYQKHLPKNIRATITSIKSMGTQIGLAAGTLFLGFIADYIGPQKVIPLTGIFGILAIICFYKIKK